MTTGLVLSGGGARAAYQVGVLKAVNEILAPKKNPFDVICGSSAGALNASLLACESDRFGEAIDLLDSVWRGLDSGDVHNVDSLAVARSVGSLVRSLFHDGYKTGKPWSLLDNKPLRELLARVVRFDRLPERIAAGDLSALSVSALGYSSGDSVAFFDAAGDQKGWRRHRRVGLRSVLGLDHLMASAAIPAIYPAVRIHREYFGDGAVRQTAPMSPALHLGARKLFVVGVSHNPHDAEDRGGHVEHSPSIAQMTGHFLNGSFIDALEEDMERLLRLNKLLGYLTPEERAEVNLAPIDVMSITPSRAFDDIAAQCIEYLPGSMRFLLKTLGATRRGGGASLASYLLFESPFLVKLIDMGYGDALVQRDTIEQFFAPNVAFTAGNEPGYR